MLLLLAACGGDGPPPAEPMRGPVAGRVITVDLWAGAVAPEAVALPRVEAQGPGGVVIRGPVQTEHPETGRTVPAYERISARAGGRRQLLTVTQGGAGLGRVVDQRKDLPERRFSDDIVFPLGLWVHGETRRFEATEHTLFGPALRLVTLEILDLDFVHDGVAHSLAYRLTIRDAAGRVLDCEHSVYSPGIGLARFDSSGRWTARSGCDACPCPG